MTPDDIFSRLYPSVHSQEDLQDADTSGRRNMSEANSENPTPFPKETPLAMSYIYFQQWGETSNPETALQRGTLFPDLDKPFERGAK